MTEMVLDVSRLIWRAWRGQLPTGIDRACFAYVRYYEDKALALVQRGGVTRVLGKRDSADLFRILLGRKEDFRRAFLLFAARACLPWRWSGRKKLRGAVYLNIGHTGLNHVGHRRWVERSGVKPLYYVHDLIPITHPHYARDGEREKHIERMTTVLRHGAGVIANSFDSLNALAAFARQAALPVPESRCIPLGIENSLMAAADEPLPPAPLSRAYFVVLGTIEGRKNHALLLRVWRQLAAERGKDVPALVIIGQRGWKADDIFRALDEEGEAEADASIIELGRCDDQMLRAYLSHARALLFPSFVEGQGLPLAEALVVGTPVIASDLDVFREMAGDIPDYIDPNDDDRWKEKILAYGDSGNADRHNQMERMKRFNPPSWENHFEQVDEFIACFKEE